MIMILGVIEIQHADTVHLLLRHLCGTDIHVAVHLHGIGADDLAADLFREFHRQGGLSGRRRPGDYDQRLFHYMILLNFFSISYLLIATIVGLPCGQLYGFSSFNSSSMSLSASAKDSSLFPFTAALQDMVAIRS